MLLITRDMPPEVLARARREHDVRELHLTGSFAPHHVLDNIAGITAILCIPADGLTPTASSCGCSGRSARTRCRRPSA